jgi:hypothetical protein
VSIMLHYGNNRAHTFARRTAIGGTICAIYSQRVGAIAAKCVKTYCDAIFLNRFKPELWFESRYNVRGGMAVRFRNDSENL